MAHEPSGPDILIAPERLIVGALDDFRQGVIAAVTQLAARGGSRLAVDLRGTQGIDATGLGVLLLLHKRARENGIKVRLLGPAPAILEVLRTTRVHLLFEVVEPDAVATVLSAPAPADEPAPVALPAPVADRSPDPEPDLIIEEPASAALPYLAVEETGDPHPPVVLPIEPEVGPPVVETGIVLERDPFPPEPASAVPLLPPPLEDEPPSLGGIPLVDPSSAAVGPAIRSSRAEPEPSVLPAVPTRCGTCGRALPTDREVQFCPWCGRSEDGASAPMPAAEPARATAPAPVGADPRGTSQVTPRPTRSTRSTPSGAPSRASSVIPPRPSASVPRPSVPRPTPVTPTPTMSTVVPQRRESMPASSDEFRTLMDATQLYHRIDEDGDARIIFPLESGRTQTAWITRNVDAIGEYAFRYVMSFVADVGEVASNVALLSSLLEQVSGAKGGGLVTRGTMLLYRMPIATQASPESLAGAVALAAGIADELETAITGEG